MENICKFVSTRKMREELNILHFVYEKNACFAPKFILPSTYSVAFVTGGTGALHTPGQTFSLANGDIFLVFPAKPYYIENTQALQYIYITFIGSRAPALIERLHAAQATPVYHGFEMLRPLWESSFSAVTEENIDMLCEGLLLYTFAHMCTEKDEPTVDDKASGMLPVKQYVDQHFTDASLTLSQVSEKFAFHPKYLSGACKTLVRLSFTAYLTERRLEYALSLIQNGVSNVRELAELCGYSDAFYFSKAFKKKYGLSPKQFMLRG